MVTRDRRDSTRGRANALRNALAGRLPPEMLFGPEMYDVIDLCVGCKACQSECPTSVDMARMRGEFLYHYHEQHGRDLRTRLFAAMPQLSRAITAQPLLAQLANAAMAMPPARALINRALGIAPARRLPGFAAERFSGWLARQQRHTPAADTVVLYVDTWAEHYEPQIARAAHAVLSAAGYQVIVPEYACCGRAAQQGHAALTLGRARVRAAGRIRHARHADRRARAIVHPDVPRRIPDADAPPAPARSGARGRDVRG
ncbi:MAG: hypothetical protein U0Z44_07855 [Kouleothrix sp.]